MAQKGTEKTLEKLKNSIAQGHYYEAHQMYRTVARRYIKQQKYSKAIQFLHDGSVSLMKAQQSASGSDLANYMLEVYKTAELPVNETSLDRVVELLGLYSPEEPGRKAYIHHAFSWTQKYGDYREGDPELHDYVGTLFYNEERYGPAEEHLLVGTNHSAQLLGELAAQAERPRGIVIARIVLQLLAMKNLHHATLAYDAFIAHAKPETTNMVPFKSAPADEAQPEPVYSNDSWLNFVRLVLLTVQRDGADLYKQLRATYGAMCAEHKGFDELLDDVGAAFFNIAKPRKQGNMLQDLMSSLFAGPPGGGQQQPQLTGRPSGVELD